jgi:hypothetical protein
MKTTINHATTELLERPGSTWKRSLYTEEEELIISSVNNRIGAGYGETAVKDVTELYRERFPDVYVGDIRGTAKAAVREWNEQNAK